MSIIPRQEFTPASLDSVLFAKRASVLPDHAHFFTTETSVFDRHAEESVFVVLVVGSKASWSSNTSSASSARFREVGKILSNRSDQAGLPLHAFVTVHRATRIADFESGGFHRSRTFSIVVLSAVDASAYG